MLTLMMFAALSGASDAKTMASDDWHALRIIQVAATPVGSPLYLRVAAGDLDGDGVADEAVVKLLCANGTLKEASYTVKSPRDLATGQASGKRQHGSVTFSKEWGPASPQLRAMTTTYDVKTLKGARLATADDWQPISLSGDVGLCPAAEAAAAGIIKSKSNITNN